MITQDYISAVKGMNYLRVRIMLKDSLLIDPTFRQFDEMVKYADPIMPNLWMDDDGDIFQNDQKTWTLQLMNQELVEVVNSFTKRRIQHIKGIISVLYADEIHMKKAPKIQKDIQIGQKAPKGTNKGNHSLRDIGKEFKRTIKKVKEEIKNWK